VPQQAANRFEDGDEDGQVSERSRSAASIRLKDTHLLCW
jgi:hypothetical protein